MMLSNTEQKSNDYPPTMPVTFNPDALRAGLATITAQRLYCTWALEPNPANPPKPKKVPYVRGGARLTGSYADANLPAKLMTLNESIDACEATGHWTRIYRPNS